MKKKILITLIFVFMMIICCMVSASAETGTYGDLSYEILNNEVVIIDCSETVTEVNIPSIINDYPVTEIGNSAFYNCSRLTNVTIPDSITSIGEYAFSECSYLINITIGNRVTQIGAYAFNGCTNLKNVYITDLVAWCLIDFKYYPPGFTGMNFDSNPLCNAENLYLNNTLVSKLEIPEGITVIKDMSFYGIDTLVSVSIPDSVKSIGKYAFSSCTNLNDIEMSNNLEIIGKSAFYCCRNLSNINIPDSVTNIGSGAFSGCWNLNNISLGKKLVSIDSAMFRECYSLTDVDIPDSVTNIDNYAFYGCENLTRISIPDSVMTIGESAFFNCDNLESVIIGENVKDIGTDTFLSCDNLKYVVIPSGITYIQNGAFSRCDNLALVFFKGDKNYWENELLISSENESLDNATKIYNAIEKIYKLETNCDNRLEDIISCAIFELPTVQNDDKRFLGWYDNEALRGNPVTFPYYGDATTLYAAWTDRTGKSFEDAFIAKANQEYTVSTTESGQYVYFEFVPRFSKEYRFYTTGNLDTYGYLYNSNKSQLTSNDDAGEGNNFYISYNLTAGQTYYITAKLYSGTGTFTFVVEEPVDYRINSVTIKDMSGSELASIPTGTFLATVSFTNVSSNADTVIILAQYTDAGAFKGLMYIQTEDVPTGSTIKLSIPVDNSNGDVAKLKAFCWESFASLTPMGNSASFPAE